MVNVGNSVILANIMILGLIRVGHVVPVVLVVPHGDVMIVKLDTIYTMEHVYKIAQHPHI